ncbi:hypothetical protein K1719_025094 [Acacia pycnantha]|nr:hypothetical protein K1719_025094 [Acacia pycnantha]
MFPPSMFNFTADYLPMEPEIRRKGTEVKILRYGATVQVVFQGINLFAGMDHPMHLHGFSFYVVVYGKGISTKKCTSKDFNLIDPSLVNTVAVPKNGWASIMLKAANPGCDRIMTDSHQCHANNGSRWLTEEIKKE